MSTAPSGVASLVAKYATVGDLHNLVLDGARTELRASSSTSISCSRIIAAVANRIRLLREDPLSGPVRDASAARVRTGLEAVFSRTDPRCSGIRPPTTPPVLADVSLSWTPSAAALELIAAIESAADGYTTVSALQSVLAPIRTAAAGLSDPYDQEAVFSVAATAESSANYWSSQGGGGGSGGPDMSLRMSNPTARSVDIPGWVKADASGCAGFVVGGVIRNAWAMTIGAAAMGPGFLAPGCVAVGATASAISQM